MNNGIAVRAIVRSVALLDRLGTSPSGLGVSELSRRVNLSKSTTHNIANTLVDCGLIRFDRDTKRYHLGAKVAYLGNAFLAGFEIRDVAQPHLLRLRDLTQETVSLHVRIEHQRTCIAQAISPLPLRRVQELGSLRPLYLGGAGITLLSGLPAEAVAAYLNDAKISPLTKYTLIDAQKLLERVGTVSRDGYFINEQESELGVVTVTTPVVDHTGRVTAALVVSGPLPRWDRAAVLRNLSAIQLVTRDISNDLGGRAGSSLSGRLKAG